MRESKVTKFWSSAEANRTAEVVLINGIPRVMMYEGDDPVGHEDFPNNTLEYAEDAAENYVLGIKKP